MMAIAFNIRYDLHIQTRAHAHGGRSSSALCGAVKGPRTLTAPHRDAHSLAQTLTASHRDCSLAAALFPPLPRVTLTTTRARLPLWPLSRSRSSRHPPLWLLAGLDCLASSGVCPQALRTALFPGKRPPFS